MAAVSFLLKEPNSTKPTPIFAFISFDGQRVKIATGLLILPKQWLKTEQRAQVRGLPDNGKLNDALILAEQQLLDCYRTHRAQGQLPSTEALRAAVVPVPAEQVAAAAAVSFWEHLDEWVAQKKAAGLLNTARTYATAARHLREFASAQRYGVDLTALENRAYTQSQSNT